MRKTHQLKIWQYYADDVLYGLKTFEVRKNDRDFRVGDVIQFQVVQPDLNSTPIEHPLNTNRFLICYVLNSNEFEGIADGYAVLGITPIWKTPGEPITEDTL